MDLGTVEQTAGWFAVTNIDAILTLALFFAQGTDRPGATRHIVLRQYLGSPRAILIAAVAAALGATFLAASAIPYLGLLPLALGLEAAWQAWKGYRDGDAGADGEQRRGRPGRARWRSPRSPSPREATTSASTYSYSPPTVSAA
ncbi:cadmium resistance transporter [Streptomyces sp. NPDC001185]|uniref:cadmium resistance transporter n=1 Tax=Streptomyces sp. NPDC001185 TaxID=3154380 RepID=UPI00332D0B86